MRWHLFAKGFAFGLCFAVGFLRGLLHLKTTPRPDGAIRFFKITHSALGQTVGRSVTRCNLRPHRRLPGGEFGATEVVEALAPKAISCIMVDIGIVPPGDGFQSLRKTLLSGLQAQELGHPAGR